jgi:hypothetical protein
MSRSLLPVSVMPGCYGCLSNHSGFIFILSPALPPGTIPRRLQGSVDVSPSGVLSPSTSPGITPGLRRNSDRLPTPAVGPGATRAALRRNGRWARTRRR